MKIRKMQLKISILCQYNIKSLKECAAEWQLQVSFKQLKMQMESPASSKAPSVNPVINWLSNVTEQLQQYQQQALMGVDKAVLQYITKRNIASLQKLQQHSKQPAHGLQQIQSPFQSPLKTPEGEQQLYGDKQAAITFLSLQQLDTLHKQSRQMLMQYQVDLHRYTKVSELMQEHNLRALKDLTEYCEHFASTHGHQLNFTSILEMLRELIVQLAKFQDVQEYCKKYALLCNNLDRSKTSANGIQEDIWAYLSKMDNYIVDTDSEDNHNDNGNEFISKRMLFDQQYCQQYYQARIYQQYEKDQQQIYSDKQAGSQKSHFIKNSIIKQKIGEQGNNLKENCLQSHQNMDGNIGSSSNSHHKYMNGAGYKMKSTLILDFIQ